MNQRTAPVSGATGEGTALERGDAAIPPSVSRALGVSARSVADVSTLRAQLGDCLRQRHDAEQRVLQLEQQLEDAQVLIDEANHRAGHDPLTGLPNRRLLIDRLDQALMHAQRRRRKVGLVLLDLDGFKHINDAFGHATGDALLVRVARALRSVIRAEDTACRFGGDEFVILLPDVGQKGSVAAIAANVQMRLHQVRSAGGARVTIAASLGLAVFPTHGKSGTELLRHADLAMYQYRARRAREADRYPTCSAPGERLPELGVNGRTGQRRKPTSDGTQRRVAMQES